jgi:DNA-binding beta-propeller fold protein YncE
MADAAAPAPRGRGATCTIVVMTLAGLVAGGCTSGGVESRAGGEAPSLDGTSAFVVTTDFQTGSFAVFPLLQPDAVARDVDRIHSDAVVRTHAGTVYVINRLGGDNIQAIDPTTGYATRWQCSVENGSNPHDLAFARPDKAYVTRYERREILIVDPTTGADCAGFVRGTVDLSSLADGDGIPEMDQAVVVGDRLYVTLQLLDRRNFFLPTDRSLIAVVDVATDTLVGSIRLTGTNPFAESVGLAPDPETGTIMLTEVGTFGRSDDGGIERVDLASQTALGFFVTESDLGGNITDVVLLDAHHAYAIVLDRIGASRVLRFDPTTRTVTSTLVAADEFLVDIELGPDGQTLFLTDRTLRHPGIRRFAIADDHEIVPAIDTGLPPFDIAFVEGP